MSRPAENAARKHITAMLARPGQRTLPAVHFAAARDMLNFLRPILKAPGIAPIHGVLADNLAARLTSPVQPQVMIDALGNFTRMMLSVCAPIEGEAGTDPVARGEIEVDLYERMVALDAYLGSISLLGHVQPPIGRQSA